MYTKKKGIQITLKPRQKAKTSRNSLPLILTNHTIITKWTKKFLILKIPRKKKHHAQKKTVTTATDGIETMTTRNCFCG